MTYATPCLPDPRMMILALASVGVMASGASADDGGAGGSISSEEGAAAYVLGVLADAGCRMRFSAFQDRVAADGMAAPSGEAGDAATLVAAAPLRLLNAGLISEDPGDPQILLSNGPGCD